MRLVFAFLEKYSYFEGRTSAWKEESFVIVEMAGGSSAGQPALPFEQL